MRVDVDWIKNVDQAIEYLIKEYEYYREKGRELNPEQEHWRGELAERLGFNGGEASSRDRYIRVMQNLHPVTGERLTCRQNTTRTELDRVWSEELGRFEGAEVEVNNRRPAAEVHFAFQKSYSAYFALSKDEDFRAECRALVEAKLRDRIEPLLGCRVRKGGAQTFRFTGNGAYRIFWHSEARPVYGHSDPQEHCHVAFANATFDPLEGKVKALELCELFKELPLIEAEVEAELARLAESRGHGIRRTEHGHELAVISPEEIATFSKRTDQLREIEKREKRAIERKVRSKAQEARRKGLPFDEEKAREEVRAGLARDYRSPKHAAKHAGEALVADWESQLAPGRKDQITPAASRSIKGEGLLTPDEAAGMAIAQAFECASVSSDRDLKIKALTLGTGRISPEEAERFASKDPRLIRAEDGRVTTHEIYQEEVSIRAKASRGKDALEPLIHEPWTFIDKELDPGQRAAVNLLLESRDRFNAVEGLAGAGKTRSFSELCRAVEQTTGAKPLFIACTGRAAEKAAEASGSSDPLTVSRFLVNPRLHQEATGRLVVVDEASVLDNATMTALMDLAEQHQFRLALVGDPNQQKPLKRGDEFTRFIESKAIQTARLDVIYRQRKNPLLLEIVTEWQTGDKARAWDRFEQEGMIRECNSYVEALEKVTDDYVAVRQHSGDVMALALRHVDGQAFADRVRPKLQDAGLLGRGEIQVQTLNSLQLLEAQKADPVYYRPGLVVQFHRRAPGFKSGDRAEVSRVEDGRVFIVKAGRELRLPLDRGRSFDVYERSALAVSEGERVTSTQALPAAHWKTSQVKTVRSVSDDRLTFTDGSTLDLAKPVPLRQGWTQTSLPAQGAEAHTVLPFVPFEASAALTPEAATVILTRAKEAMRLYTNSAELIRGRALATSERPDAHEVVRPSPSQDQAIDLQQGAIRTSEPVKQTEVYPDRKVSAYERSLWKRAAAKYPLDARTPEQQQKLRRKIARMVQEHERHHATPPAAYQQEQARGYDRGL